MKELRDTHKWTPSLYAASISKQFRLQGHITQDFHISKADCNNVISYYKTNYLHIQNMYMCNARVFFLTRFGSRMPSSVSNAIV